jgi:hypothetical protein
MSVGVLEGVDGGPKGERVPHPFTRACAPDSGTLGVSTATISRFAPLLRNVALGPVCTRPGGPRDSGSPAHVSTTPREHDGSYTTSRTPPLVPLAMSGCWAVQESSSPRVHPTPSHHHMSGRGERGPTVRHSGSCLGPWRRFPETRGCTHSRSSAPR